ncbi:hypothetical protein EV694_0844 [Volucribacter psittacicida]|uniref:Uncharacterized protein n=1 Tax=Volucribacter psittacicida TaxID=203482 RepID=A0A4R1FW70_9PAST|nr:hypothetical protein [Volucribacter psittacicida]TCJ98440.1 hypothetical protein EV694_0844 [Volucribacter psittacicida]
MAIYVVTSILISFFLNRYLFVGVTSGWIAYGIANLFIPEWATAIGIIIGIIGSIPPDSSNN